MKIAVTYDNGKIFQHFGRTEEFKLYEVENRIVISEEILSSGGIGHEALAGLLQEKGVEILICGGMGQGAKDALFDAGIDVYSGAEGEADDAVQDFLDGTLESKGVTCDHHGDEDDTEGCGGECGSCGGGCGGCGGCGGGAPRIILEGPNAGKTVKTHYRGTFNDGTQFDSSYDRGEPLEFICGAGMMIPGFDKAVVDMQVGEVRDVHLMPEEAYGMPDPNAIFTVKISDLQGAEELNAGERIYLRNMYGQPFPVSVIEKTADEITFDANHEMAGKELNFTIELVEVKD